MGARRVGLEVLVMEYKLGMPVFLKVGKKKRKNTGARFCEAIVTAF